MGSTAAILARELGLPADEIRLIRQAAPLHDVGKIGVPDRILLKPDTLTPDEFRQMMAHTVIGARILSGSRFRLLQTAEEIALTHHERWDGTGYPHGLAGGDIPLTGRIVAVADAFDALTHDRPYKRAWPIAEAVAEVQGQAGRQFDPAGAAAFVHVLPEVLRVRQEPDAAGV